MIGDMLAALFVFFVGIPLVGAAVVWLFAKTLDLFFPEY